MTRMAFMFGAGTVLAGVAAGAFGAHALRESLGAEWAPVYETGVRYQLVHGLALLFVGLASDRWPAAGWRAAMWLFFAGILLFSGSLYALSLTGIRGFGAVTPLGGASFLVGWAFVMRACWVGVRRPE